VSLREINACNIAALTLLADATKDVDCSSSLGVIYTLQEKLASVPECEVLKERCPAYETLAGSGGDDDF
jgi:hypothetical protein